MNLREKLVATPQGFASTTETSAEASGALGRDYQETKSHVHQVLLGRLDLQAMEGLSPRWWSAC